MRLTFRRAFLAVLILDLAATVGMGLTAHQMASESSILPAWPRPLQQQPATLYVAPSGTDSGACPQTAPCANLAYVSMLTHPGDTVVMQPGTYGPQTIDATGTATAPITVQAAGVTLTRIAPAPDALQKTPLLQIKNSAYVTVSGLSAIGMKGRSDYVPADQPIGGEVVVEAYGTTVSSNITVDGISVAHANQTCFKVQDAEQYVTVENSTFTDCGQPGNGLDHALYITGQHSSALGNTVTGSTGYGLHFHTDVRFATISNNVVSGAAYAGIIDDGPDGVITGNTVSGNAWGMTLANRETVTGNVFSGNTVNAGGQSAYGILFGANNQPMSGEDVEHNTFYRDGTEIQSNVPSDGTNTITSNIFVGRSTSDKVLPLSASNAGDVLDYNDYAGITPPSVTGSHSIKSNPQFVAAPQSFALASGSPCIGSGTNGSDMGAY